MNMQPTALIAEDEPLLRSQLRLRLREAWPELEIRAEAENGEEALRLFDEHEPRIAFLDIQMPVVSGIDVARRLSGRAHVVFVTAFDQYAVEAFEHGAIDYVLKPVTAERIALTVERLKERLTQAPAALDDLLDRLSARASGRATFLRWIRASLGTTLKLIAVSDVIYFQSEDKYTKVITAEGEGLIKKTIKELQGELDPEQFWQVHRSTIVNLEAIASVGRDYRDQPVIQLKSRSESLIVSRTYAHLFKQM
jgi:DNA-binding LytR/AlgR family response regulator